MGGLDARNPERMPTDKFRIVDSAFESIFLEMTGSATHQGIRTGPSRHSAIIKQVTAKINSLNSHGIICRNLYISWKEFWNNDLIRSRVKPRFRVNITPC